MNRMTTSVKMLLACSAASILLVGCKSQQTVKAEPKAAEAPVVRHAGWPRNASDGTMNWASMAYPTGDARTSALGIEKGVPREVRLNQSFDYLIVVTNLTSLSLDNVVVTDQPGPNYKFTKATPECQVGAGGLMTWAVGGLGPNESKTIRVTGMATKEPMVSSCASATYSSALCSAIPVVSPKLMLTMSGPAQASRCDEITYILEVANTGTGSITGVKINDMLPAGLMTADGKKSADFAIGNLEAGQKRTVTAKVRADKSGKYENKAIATADGGMTAESAVVSTTLVEPALAITKKCPSKQFIGRNLDYEITVTNNGQGASLETILEDGIPAGTTFVSASDGGKAVGGKTVWNLGTLEPKASKTVRVSLGVMSAGSYSSVAMVRGVCAAAVNATCSSEVTGIPAILLEVVDIEDPSPVGSNNTYVITVTNQGSAPGTNIKIVATLEPNQSYISSQGPTTGTASGSTVTFAPLPSLAAKDKAVYRVVVKNAKAGDVRFKVTMTSDQLTRSVEETEATNVYE